MRRLSLWMRQHPTFGACLLALFLVLLELPVLFGGRYSEPWWVYAAVDLLLIGPIVLRRRRPVLSAYAVLAGGVAQFVLDVALHNTSLIRAGDIALCISLYTMLVYVGRTRALAYLAWLLCGIALWAWLIVRPAVPDWYQVTAAVLVSLGFCWLLGEFVGARRAYQAEVEQRLRLLENERDQQAKIAVAEERARIARELHDVVAHAVSVMVVHADGASYAVHSNPDVAERAVRTISSTGREALAELRRLLGVLRAKDADEPKDRAPQPSTDSLGDLADRIQTVGLPVELKLDGELDGLPAGIGLGVYRIVQEALTNSLKHAGAGASAVVQVARIGNTVEVDVTDDGSGTPRDPVGVSGGNGLIGMRERATVFGGTLDAGPLPGGGWHVRATLPVQGTIAP